METCKASWGFGSKGAHSALLAMSSHIAGPRSKGLEKDPTSLVGEIAKSRVKGHVYTAGEELGY